MSSGMAPNHCWIVTWGEVKKIVPEAAAKFEEAVGDLSQFSIDWDMGESEFEAEFNELDVAFGRATSYEGMGIDDDDPMDCLRLVPMFYSESSGDIYDTSELHEDLVFQVLGVEEMTPAGEKFSSHLTEAFWVQYG